jgi:hypothetical protein
MVQTIIVASYYDPAGGTGACGSVLHKNDFVVALGEDTWANGAHCGATIPVTCTHGVVHLYLTKGNNRFTLRFRQWSQHLGYRRRQVPRLQLLAWCSFNRLIRGGYRYA